MHRFASRALLALAGTIFAAAPLDARAYNCTAVSGKQITQAWNQRCIPYKLDTRGTLLKQADSKQLLAQSFRVWSDQACTDLEFFFAGDTEQGPAFNPAQPAGNENVIVSIEEEKDLAAFPQDGLLAITLTSYSVETGEILDADILINAVDFRFDDVSDPTACRLGRMAFDLRNTMIHEMGHFIGFDHQPATDSTMFASAEMCETKKRDLSEDDKLGVCTVYAKDQATKSCKPPIEGYDSGGDVSPFRCQCDRFTGVVSDECRDQGCSCVAAAGLETRAAPWKLAGLFGGGLAMIVSITGWARRRRSR